VFLKMDSIGPNSGVRSNCAYLRTMHENNNCNLTRMDKCTVGGANGKAFCLLLMCLLLFRRVQEPGGPCFVNLTDEIANRAIA